MLGLIQVGIGKTDTASKCIDYFPTAHEYRGIGIGLGRYFWGGGRRCQRQGTGQAILPRNGHANENLGPNYFMYILKIRVA